LDRWGKKKGREERKRKEPNSKGTKLEKKEKRNKGGKREIGIWGGGGKPEVEKEKKKIEIKE